MRVGEVSLTRPPLIGTLKSMSFYSTRVSLWQWMTGRVRVRHSTYHLLGGHRAVQQLYSGYDGEWVEDCMSVLIVTTCMHGSWVWHAAILSPYR